MARTRAGEREVTAVSAAEKNPDKKIRKRRSPIFPISNDI